MPLSVGNWHDIYLIPGFFGFAHFGEIKYFSHVHAQLERTLESHGLKGKIHFVETRPTAALERRAERLADVIRATARPDSSIHLIGHSSGGLDARLLMTPSLSALTDTASFLPRVESVVTIVAPNWGTPLVSTLVGAVGPSLLGALSLATLHGLRLGSVPLPALVALAGVIPRIGRFNGPVLRIVNQVYDQLLRDFDDDRQDVLERFLRETSDDQELIPQLSIASMAEFNRHTPMKNGTRFGCVVARGQRPSLRHIMAVGLSAEGQATYAVYRALNMLCSQMPEDAVPPLEEHQAAKLQSHFGSTPLARDNDAIVPTLSQVYGDVIHAANADHLDVIGHFADTTTDPPHVGWLTSHSGFGQPQFHSLWTDVGDFLFGTTR